MTWEKKNIKLFYINKSDYKTSYATAVADRFIRTIKDKLHTYQQVNESASIIKVIKEIVEGYNNSVHRMIGKTPNEMTKEDVRKNVIEKRAHNDHVLANFQFTSKIQT